MEDSIFGVFLPIFGQLAGPPQQQPDVGGQHIMYLSANLDSRP